MQTASAVALKCRRTVAPIRSWPERPKRPILKVDVSATAIGGEGLAQRLSANAGELDVQRVLSRAPDLADVGKQLLVTARRPA